LSDQGDSGGPVYQIKADGTLYGRGDIVGGAEVSINGVYAYRTAYTPVQRIDAQFNQIMLTMRTYQYSCC